jgi:SAM-dependent methyltransferase
MFWSILKSKGTRHRANEVDGQLPTQLDNYQLNRLFWNSYAAYWESSLVVPEDPLLQLDRSKLTLLGQEWGTVSSLNRVLREFVLPYCNTTVDAAEIGCGGGRIAAHVSPIVHSLLCCDISAPMLELCKKALINQPNVTFKDIASSSLLPEYESTMDFVYAFDVMVHLDLHTIWRSMCTIHDLLKPGGYMFIHTANLLTEMGWRRFESQLKYSPPGFYFVTPEIVRTLLTRAGFAVVRESVEDPQDFYFGRDLMILARRL